MVTSEHGAIGRRIKEARQGKGLSLLELAEKAGCAEEYLGWIEEDQAEPPVSLLLRLAKALRVDPGLFLGPTEATGRSFEEETKRTQHYSYKTLTPSEPDKHLMAFAVNLPPHTPHDGAGYQHDGEEFVYVLSGQVELTVGDEKVVLSEKESFRFSSGIDHHLANSSDREAELLVILYVP